MFLSKLNKSINKTLQNLNSKTFHSFEGSYNKIISNIFRNKKMNFLKFERKNIYNKKNDEDDICKIFIKIFR